jgi:hypothetical protein
MKEIPVAAGSHKNIWHGIGRKRIEIPKSVLKAKVLNNKILQQLYMPASATILMRAAIIPIEKKDCPRISFSIALTATDGTRSEKQRIRLVPTNSSSFRKT